MMKIDIRPLPIGLIICLFGVSLGPLTSIDKNEAFEFHGSQGVAMATAAIFAILILATAFLLLVGGFMHRSRVVLLIGYLLTAGIFTWRATLAFIESGWVHPAPWISLGLATMCGMAYGREFMSRERDKQLRDDCC